MQNNTKIKMIQRIEQAKQGRKMFGTTTDEIHHARQEAIIKFLASHRAFDFHAMEIAERINLSYSIIHREIEALKFKGVISVTRRIGQPNRRNMPFYQLSSWLREGDREAERWTLYSHKFLHTDNLEIDVFKSES